MNEEVDGNFDVRFDQIYKIILVGDMGVGKSCLLSKYVKGVFPTSPLPTIAVEFSTKIIQLKEGSFVKAQIWDTAGQEKYKSITSLYLSYKISHYRKAVGALLVYDVSKKSSFNNIQRWLNEIRQNAEPDCIILLVGNKVDLVEKNNRKREVTYEEGNYFADENKLLFIETSALTNYKVNEAFEDLLQKVFNERRKVSNIITRQQRYNHAIKLNQVSESHEDTKCC